jgi:glycine oxidase
VQGLKRRSYDAVVVGAGVIGLACAWRVAQRGLSVLVLERDRPGAGASGLAAGMLAPVTEADFGELDLLRANLASRELWEPFEAELRELSAVDLGYEPSGALMVAADRDDAEELRRLHAFKRSLGLEAEWLTPSACRRLEPGLSPRVAGGFLAPRDGYADPSAVLRALDAALEREGGELVTGVEVESIELAGERAVGVRTPSGAVAAESVVVASGCRALPELEGSLQPPVRPVKGQLLELRARTGAALPASRVVRTPRCYLVTRGDGRVVLGATVEERGFDTTVTADGVYRLLEAAWEVLPDVGELELVAGRAGLRPGTPDNAPAIGRGGVEGLLWATGHYRNGVLLAPLTALAIAELLTGGEPPEPVAPFDPARFAASHSDRALTRTA